MAEGNRLPQLTANGQKLIQKLTELPQTWLTAATLAQAIGVSRRTVLRELPGVEQWMRAAGFSFQRSPGQGILLDEGEEARTRLRGLLEVGEADNTLSRKERRQRLLVSLFAAREPVKTYALARELMISEQTLTGDLNQLEEWLEPYEIRLWRRPGVGVWLEGTPEKMRRAVGSLLRVNLPEDELQVLLQGNVPQGSRLSALLTPSVASAVWGILQQFERQEGLHFTDTGFLSLAVHITLTIQQLQQGIVSDTVPAEAVSVQQAERLAKRLRKTFSLDIPQGEIQYLAIYLDAYRGLPVIDEQNYARELDLRHLAATLIGAMAQALEVDFSPYPTLADDLCCHLRPMLHRMEQGIRVENPQLELIQEQYPHLWRATRTACDQVQRELGLPVIPDEEAAYLSMHFGAVIEQDSLMKMRLCAVVVCPYGMASSRFLTSQLIRDFPIFHIRGSCSVRELDANVLRAQGVDVIISTIPLQIDFPHYCINPILQEQDRAVLRAAVAQLQKPDHTPAPPERQKTPKQPENLRYTGQLSAVILDLMDHVTIQKALVPGSRRELIAQGARLFCPLLEDSNAVEEAFLRREKLGETYFAPLQAVLLHCKTNAVFGCRLGYLQAEPPVLEPGKTIQGALVLLAPDRPEDSLSLEVMQSVSALLIQEPRLMETLRAGNRRQAAAILEQGLVTRFRQALSQRWKQK